MKPQDLLNSQRWAALATVDATGTPYASSAAVAIDPDSSTVLLHLSELAAHTRNLLDNPSASLLLAEPDPGSGDPQELARLTLTGPVRQVPQSDHFYASLSEAYQKVFPDAGMRFGFTDFHLFQLLPTAGNYVGGFGKAGKLDQTEVKALFESDPS